MWRHSTDESHKNTLWNWTFFIIFCCYECTIDLIFLPFYDYCLLVDCMKRIFIKLIVPTRNTRFLSNLTLDWLTTAIRRTGGALRTFHSANLQESTTPCSIQSVSGNSPLISWAWVGWGRLCLKSTTYILLCRPRHHQGYKLTARLCFQRYKHLMKPQVATWVVSLLMVWPGEQYMSGAFQAQFSPAYSSLTDEGWIPPDTVYWAGSVAFLQVCRVDGSMDFSCSLDGSRESVKWEFKSAE